ncbi:MAG TPA: CsbD family protein [Oscillatoriales cyanobacterium M59_W2019_021]|nr:CsbD family protein [Oscillatoriales cyanobacterium M4454_W2019_049]HIK51882.1 CsbD family protein [Oscillatoriales cyanobacterium M59_W2019_021]
MKTNRLPYNIKLIVRRFQTFLFCAIAISATWVGIALAATPSAIASSLELHSQFLATDVIQDLDSKAKSDLDTVAGAGTSDKLEGQVDQALGKAQRDLGKVSGQVEGAARQAKGKAKEDIGTTRQAIENAADNAEDASDSAFDSIKNFFSR